MSNPKGPDQINCAHCGRLFPRGLLSVDRKNQCSDECREALKEKQRMPRHGFTDADAERIFQQKFGRRMQEYYSGFVYRPRHSSIYGAAEIGGANKRTLALGK